MESKNTTTEPLPGLKFATNFPHFNDLCTEHLQGVPEAKRQEIATSLHAGHYQKFKVTLTGTVSKTSPDGHLTLLGQDIKAYGLRRDLVVSNPFGKAEAKTTKAKGAKRKTEVEQRKVEEDGMKIWEEKLGKHSEAIERTNGVGGDPFGDTPTGRTWEKFRRQAEAVERVERGCWEVVEKVGWVGVFVLGMAVGIVLGIEMCAKFGVVVVV